MRKCKVLSWLSHHTLLWVTRVPSKMLRDLLLICLNSRELSELLKLLMERSVRTRVGYVISCYRNKKVRTQHIDMKSTTWVLLLQ